VGNYYFWVGLGGSIGALFRFGLGNIIKSLVNIPFPIATFTVNIIGCLLIGLIQGQLSKNPSSISPQITLFLSTGLLGGFTTFSAFSLESVEMLQLNNSSGLIINVVGQVGLGLTAVLFGKYLAGAVF